MRPVWQHAPDRYAKLWTRGFGLQAAHLRTTKSRPILRPSPAGHSNSELYDCAKRADFAGRFLSPADRWPARRHPRPAVLPLIGSASQLRLSMSIPASGGRIPAITIRASARAWRGLTEMRPEIRSTKMGGFARMLGRRTGLSARQPKGGSPEQWQPEHR